MSTTQKQSTTKRLDNITDQQIKNMGVQALAVRPNSASQHGQSGLSAAQLQEWFDKLAEYLARKLNEIHNKISSVEAAFYIRLALDDYGIENLGDLVTSFANGTFASQVVQVAKSPASEEFCSLQVALNGILQDISKNKEMMNNHSALSVNGPSVPNEDPHGTYAALAALRDMIRSVEKDVLSAANAAVEEAKQTAAEALTAHDADSLAHASIQTRLEAIAREANAAGTHAEGNTERINYLYQRVYGTGHIWTFRTFKEFLLFKDGKSHISDPSSLTDGDIYVDELISGDTILIVEEGVPDFWFERWGNYSDAPTVTYEGVEYSMACAQEGIGVFHLLESENSGAIVEKAVEATHTVESISTGANGENPIVVEKRLCKPVVINGKPYLKITTL